MIAISFIYVLDSTHIKSPIGIEIIIALFRTAKVLSRNDLIIVFIIDGFLYGGSSSINVCLSLLFNNLDNILDISSVVNTDIIIRTIKVRDEKIEFDVIKIIISVISVGNLPLHGMNTFVSIAISLSFLFDIILAPITPHALHPHPIHIVSDCFPLVPHF